MVNPSLADIKMDVLFFIDKRLLCFVWRSCSRCIQECRSWQLWISMWTMRTGLLKLPPHWFSCHSHPEPLPLPWQKVLTKRRLGCSVCNVNVMLCTMIDFQDMQASLTRKQILKQLDWFDYWRVQYASQGDGTGRGVWACRLVVVFTVLPEQQWLTTVSLCCSRSRSPSAKRSPTPGGAWTYQPLPPPPIHTLITPHTDTPSPSCPLPDCFTNLPALNSDASPPPLWVGLSMFLLLMSNYQNLVYNIGRDTGLVGNHLVQFASFNRFWAVENDGTLSGPGVYSYCTTCVCVPDAERHSLYFCCFNFQGPCNNLLVFFFLNSTLLSQLIMN